MPRLPRIYFEGALNYVIAEADHDEELFKDDVDYSSYLSLVKKYKEQYQFKLFSFLLTPNKIHLLIEPYLETTISQIMHDINSAYTKYFNSRYEKTGHLFKERFRIVLVEKQSYITGLSRLIHLLPVEAHLVSRPGDYKWSSYQLFLSVSCPQVEVDTKEILENFSLDLEKARLLYREFVELAPKNEIAVLVKKLQDASFLGSKEFVGKIKEKYTVKKESAQQEKPESPRVSRRARVLVLVALVFSVGLSSYFLRGYLGMNKSIEKEVSSREAKRDLENNQQLKMARESIKSDLEQKYQADIVSSQALVKKLGQEKKKVQGL